jgi:hypothetical protein
MDLLRKAGLSRAECQKRLYDMIQCPCNDFYWGRKPFAEARAVQIPTWMVEKCQT